MPVRVVDVDDLLRAEHDENVLRLDFRRSEAVAIGREIEERERAAAKERQSTLNNEETASGKLPEAVKGDSRDKVAATVGMSGRTYEKAKQVVAAAEAEPAVFADLVERMGR